MSRHLVSLGLTALIGLLALTETADACGGRRGKHGAAYTYYGHTGCYAPAVACCTGWAAPVAYHPGWSCGNVGGYATRAVYQPTAPPQPYPSGQMARPVPTGPAPGTPPVPTKQPAPPGPVPPAPTKQTTPPPPVPQPGGAVNRSA